MEAMTETAHPHGRQAIDTTGAGGSGAPDFELENTWPRTLTVWWSYFWRSMLCALVGWILLVFFGIFIGMVVVALKVPPKLSFPLLAGFNFAVFIVLSILPFRQILNKTFNGFRLVLLRVDAADQPADMSADVPLTTHTAPATDSDAQVEARGPQPTGSTDS